MDEKKRECWHLSILSAECQLAADETQLRGHVRGRGAVALVVGDDLHAIVPGRPKWNVQKSVDWWEDFDRKPWVFTIRKYGD